LHEQGLLLGRHLLDGRHQQVDGIVEAVHEILVHEDPDDIHVGQQGMLRGIALAGAHQTGNRLDPQAAQSFRRRRRAAQHGQRQETGV
jgi:hypothetical protein